MPSAALDNCDSRISSDVDQMFREFFNVAAIMLTNLTIFVVIMAITVGKSRLTQIAILALTLFTAVCLPLVNYFVAPASAAVAVLKQRDGSFNFQVSVRLRLTGSAPAAHSLHMSVAACVCCCMRILLYMSVAAHVHRRTCLLRCNATVLQHSRVKKYCESIAFYAGHQRERAAIAQTFNRLGLGFRVQSLGFKFKGLGFRV